MTNLYLVAVVFLGALLGVYAILTAPTLVWALVIPVAVVLLSVMAVLFGQTLPPPQE